MKTTTAKLRPPRGNSRAYLLSRLLRDAATCPTAATALAAYRRGEHSSVYAAAKAAGIVSDTSPIAHLIHWWNKATPAERTRFLAHIHARAPRQEETGI